MPRNKPLLRPFLPGLSAGGQDVSLFPHARFDPLPLQTRGPRRHRRAVPAKTVLPDWFRKLPAVDKQHASATNNGLTIKRCMPFLDALTTGWILPLAATVRLEIKDDGRTVDAGWEFDRPMVSNHGAASGRRAIRRSRDRPASSTITGRSARRRAGAASSCRRSTAPDSPSNASPGSSTPTPTHAHIHFPFFADRARWPLHDREGHAAGAGHPRSAGTAPC